MEEEAHYFFIVASKSALHPSLSLQTILNNSANHRCQIEMDPGEIYKLVICLIKITGV